jgi:Zn-dependent peptidase ImmA (M78 family)
MGLGDRPAKSLVTVLEEQYGIQVWYADLGRDGSAACVKGDLVQAILMNTTEAPWRRNFSFGHELFHLITWDSPNCSEPIVHKLANAFASSLLLPSDAVTPEFERRLTPRGISLADLITLAREFEVSTEALLWRLVNLRLLDHDVVEHVLTNDDFRNVDRTSMASSWWSPPPLPERFVRLAFLAYQKGKLSKAVLADYLGVSLIELKTRLLEYGLDETADYDASVPAAA